VYYKYTKKIKCTLYDSQGYRIKPLYEKKLFRNLDFKKRIKTSNDKNRK